jgi:hypothetical protein
VVTAKRRKVRENFPDNRRLFPHQANWIASIVGSGFSHLGGARRAPGRRSSSLSGDVLFDAGLIGVESALAIPARG